MDIITLTVFCLVVCLALKLVGAVNGEVKLICTVAAVCVIAARYFDSFREIYSAVNALFSQTGLEADYLGVIVKSLGICFTSQVGCDCCRDCGENALASQLELTGKAAMLLTALPLLDNAVEIVRALMQV